MTGTLGLFSLVDLFQLLAASSRSGRLTVDHPEGPARVYFEEGVAVHAEFGPLSGENAIYALFADEQGSFEFMLGVPAPRNTIETRTENLILEASRRLDESRRGAPSPAGSGDLPGAGASGGPGPRPARTPANLPSGSAHAPSAPRQNPAGPGRLSAPGGRPDSQRRAQQQEAAHPQAPHPQPRSLGQEPSSGRAGQTFPQPNQAEPQRPRGELRSSESVPTAPVAHAEVLEQSATESDPGVATTDPGGPVRLAAIPSFAEHGKTVADMSLSKDEVAILRCVDGKRSVADVARQAKVAPEVAQAAIQRLRDVGVLRLASRKPRTARLVTQLASVRLPHGVVGVDPSIMSSWEKALGYPAQSVACRLEDGRVCLLGAMPLERAGPFMMINRETLVHADLAVNQPLLVRPVPQSEG